MTGGRAVGCDLGPKVHEGLAGQEYLQESKVSLGSNSCGLSCSCLLPALTSCGFNVVIARTMWDPGGFDVAVAADLRESRTAETVPVA